MSKRRSYQRLHRLVALQTIRQEIHHAPESDRAKFLQFLRWLLIDEAKAR